jgi:hypothetical protein
VRAVLAVTLASLLGACASGGGSTQSVGNWRIERSIDRISGAPAARVYLEKKALNAQGKFDQAILQLACFDGRPIVRIGFSFRIGTNRNATVEYRFDANPGRKAYAEILTDHRTIVIEEKGELAQFVGELASAVVLLVRVISLSDPRTEVQFQVAGAQPAIEAAYAACPLERATAGR